MFHCYLNLKHTIYKSIKTTYIHRNTYISQIIYYLNNTIKNNTFNLYINMVIIVIFLSKKIRRNWSKCRTHHHRKNNKHCNHHKYLLLLQIISLVFMHFNQSIHHMLVLCCIWTFISYNSSVASTKRFQVVSQSILSSYRNRTRIV